MASLKQPFSVDSGDFSEKDKEIADRLQKLKRDRIKGMLISCKCISNLQSCYFSKFFGNEQKKNATLINDVLQN